MCPQDVTQSTWHVTVAEVNGLPVTHPTTDCIEVDYINLTGPPTATVGVAAPYSLSWSTTEPAEVEYVVGIDEGGIATGPIWGETGDDYRQFYLRWLIQGTHTVTARVETPCSYAEASVSTEITTSVPFTDIIPLLPIGDCNTDDPDSACYFSCTTCPQGDYLWDIGGWIEWLLCWLICLFQWLARVMLWIGLTVVNALIGVFNIVLTWDGSITADVIHWIEYQAFVWSNFITQTFANIGEFFSDHILLARDWMYEGLTWLADEFENGGNLLGDNVEAFFTELADWTNTNLTEIGETANTSITSYGEASAINIENFRDWSYEGLLELADYFSGWGTGLGDFLALLVTVVANFLYYILTLYADFTRNLYDQLGNLVEAVFIWAGQAIYIVLVTIGKLLNAFFTIAGLYIATIIRLLRDNLYVWMTVLAAAVDGFFTGLGLFLAMIVNGVAEFIKLIVFALNAIMAGLAMAAQLAVALIAMAVDAILLVYAAVIWVSQLVLSLLDALVTSFQSDTVPEMYTDAEGLYYFWRGLAFFEDIAESSPLATVNTIAIGMIGINLLFWTVRQISDVISDILNFA